MLMNHFYLNACSGNVAFFFLVTGNVAFNNHCCSSLFFFFFVFFSFMFRLVDKINVSIGQDPSSKCLIGVLDIYGFESFKTNR